MVNCMQTISSYSCPACGVGTVRPLAAAGRRWPYKNLPDLELAADVEVPTCDECGEEWLGADEHKELDRVLNRAYRNEMSKKAQKYIEEIGRSMHQFELEPLLGLSAGYISKLKYGKVPSGPLVACLALIANDVLHRVDEIRRAWRVLPTPVAHGSASSLRLPSQEVTAFRPQTTIGEVLPLDLSVAP